MADRRRVAIPWHADDTEAALHDRYRREANPLVKTRLHALWLLRQGHSLRETAALVGVEYRSLQRWLDWYRAGGLPEVCRHTGRSPGRVRWLSGAQEQALCAHLAEGGTFTAADVQQYLQTAHGVTYRPGSVYTVLGRLHCHPKVPRPRSASTTPELQAAWKKGGS